MFSRAAPRFLLFALPVLLIATLGGPSPAAGQTPGQLQTQHAPAPFEGSAQLQRERERWFWQQRAFPNGVPANAIPDALRQARALPMQTGSSNSGAVGRTTPTWTELGPHPISTYSPWVVGHSGGAGLPPVSGRANLVAVDPNNTSIAYVATEGGGVWKTIDGGATWVPIFDNQPSLSTDSIAIDPANTQIVLVGTGEYTTWGAGMFRSVDGGGHWTPVGEPALGSCSIQAIAFNPDDPTIVMAGASTSFEGQTLGCGTIGTSSDKRGVYRSTDSGQTWTKVSTGSTDSLAYETGGTPTWYAGRRGYGIFRSTDGGDTWTPVPGLSVGTVNAAYARSVVSVSPVDPQRIFVVIGGTDGFGSLHTSPDGGSTWLTIPTPATFCSYPDGKYPQCGYDLSMAADPNTATTVYVGAVRLWKATFDGTNWVLTELIGQTGPVHTDIQGLTFDSSGHLWVANDGGVFWTNNGGTSFSNLNATLGVTTFYPGATGSAAGPLLGGAQDEGTDKYSGSLSWEAVYWGDGGYTAIDPTNHSTFYITTDNRVARSLDGGVSFPSAFDFSGLAANFIPPFIMSPANPQRQFYGANAVQGMDWMAGHSWRMSPVFKSKTKSCCVSAIGPAPSSTKTAYAGTTFGALEVTKNLPSNWAKAAANATWTNTASNGLPKRYVNDIVVNPTNPANAWVTMSGFGSGHVYVTTNYGAKWKNVSGNLPDDPVDSLAVNTATGPATLYAGTDIGVFVSTDGGVTWGALGTGMPIVPVTSLIFDATATPFPTLIAATYGRGMWSIPQP